MANYTEFESDSNFNMSYIVNMTLNKTTSIMDTTSMAMVTNNTNSTEVKDLAPEFV